MCEKIEVRLFWACNQFDTAVKEWRQGRVAERCAAGVRPGLENLNHPVRVPVFRGAVLPAYSRWRLPLSRVKPQRARRRLVIPGVADLKGSSA